MAAIAFLAGAGSAGAAPCMTDGDCDDGLFCNGIEHCAGGTCVALSPCPPFIDGCISSLGCDEVSDTCPVGPNDALCDDGVFCNGVEHCDAASKACVAIDPCPAVIDGCVTYGTCDEATDSCPGVPNDALCNDGVFCNGLEHCDAGTKACVAIDSCPASINGCVTYGTCDEATDSCPGVPNDTLCPEGQSCQADGNCLPVPTTTSTTTTTSTVASTSSTSTATSVQESTTTIAPTTSSTSTTSTTLPPDDHPLSGQRLLLRDRSTDTARRLLQASSRDGAQLGLADVPDPQALLAGGGSLRVAAVGGDGFDATYPLGAEGWRLLKKKAPAKGMRFASSTGPIRKVMLKAGKQLQILGKGSALDQSLATEPDVVWLELRIGPRRYCLAFGGAVNRFTAGKSLLRERADRPAACR